MWSRCNKSCNHICIALPLVSVLRLFLFLFIFEASMLVLLKNSHSLTMSVQLAAFNFIPAKFQSRPSQRPLTFDARAYTLPHLPFTFPGLLVDTALVLLFSTLVDRGFSMYSGNTSKKSKKAAIFCLNISLTKSIDHSWVSWERGSEMERHVLFSNNSYLHPFLPLCCCVVVGRTSALFLGELLGLKLFYASAPRAPIWKLLCVSFHTLLSSSRVLPLTLREPILWGILYFVINRSRKDDKFVSAWKIPKTFVLLLHYLYMRGLNFFWWKTVLTRPFVFW